MNTSDYASNVFINCPFDEQYHDIFHAITFCVFDAGYVPRCALEIDDGAQVRIEKIMKIVSECKYGIHDISRTELDAETNLPRFNMPLELGLFLGARKFGVKKQKEKVCLILDRDQFRYQVYLSDLAGQDIRSHERSPAIAVRRVRDWLNASSGRVTIPGWEAIWKRYSQFNKELPALCGEVQLQETDLTYKDFCQLAYEWLKVNEQSLAQ